MHQIKVLLLFFFYKNHDNIQGLQLLTVINQIFMADILN